MYSNYTSSTSMCPYFIPLLFIDLDSVLWRKIRIHSLLSSSHLVECRILQDGMKRKNGLIQQQLCIKLFSAMSSPCTLFYGFLLHIKLLRSIKPIQYSFDSRITHSVKKKNTWIYIPVPCYISGKS